MENTLLIGLSRQVALQRELDVVANNLANLNTTGFKGEQMAFETYLMPVARADQFQRPDRTLNYVQDRGTWHQLEKGETQFTGNPYDVALDGDGFLAVETPRGERYTRNGALLVNSKGELVTNEGMRVLSESGPVVLQPEDGEVTIGRDGSINTRQGSKGRLKLVQFDNAQRLKKEGSSLFDAAGQAAQPSTTTRVHQGSIEKSNVKSVVEMSRMIEITRAYATLSSLLEKQGDLKRTAIEKLAEVPN